MRKSRTIVAAGLAGSLILAGFTATPAFAVTQADVDAASAKLSELGEQLSQIQTALSAATDDVETTSYQIGEKQSEVEATRADLASKKDELSAMMRSNYKQGSASALDYILGSTSIDDLVSRVIYMDKVSEQRSEKIESVKIAEQALEQEQSDLESKQAEQDEKVSSLQSQADDYYARVNEATSYFNSLDSELQEQIAAAAAAEAASKSVAVAVQAIQETPAVQQSSEQTAQQSSASATSSESADTGQDQGSQESASRENTSRTEDSGSDSGSGSSTGTTNSSSGTTHIPTGGGVSTALAAAEANAPYVYGATGPDSFDCSGLVCYSYGYARGRTTYDMIASLQSDGSWKNSMDELSYGDLIFTSEGHVGIYLGGGQMVHAPRPGSSVCVTSVWACIGGGTY